MGAIREYRSVSRNLFLCVCVIAASLIIHCDSRKTRLLPKDQITIINNHLKNLRKFKHLDIDPTLMGDVTASLPSYNPQPYISSPFSLPPFDLQPPISLPDSIGSSSPPLCLNPPSTPIQTLPSPPSSIPITQNPPPASPSPSQSYPSPSIPDPSPPGSSSSFPTPTTPTQNPTPPGSSSVPTPATPGQSPPDSEPTPPGDSEPTPPGDSEPTPPGDSEPSPPLFMPPVVYPPPVGPPSSGGGGGGGGSGSLWCVAKPSVPDPIIQEAMNYACGSGADCNDIQESGKCYQPDTLIAHASYAFNSYWQRTKVAGGTCDFGGTAMLVTVDPSNDGCHFIYA